MKQLTLLLSLILLSITLFGQNAFYDAQYLATISKINLENISKAAELGDANFNLSEQEGKMVKNYTEFKKNPFGTDVDELTGLDIGVLNSAITKYNKYVEIEKQKWMSGSMASPYVGVAGMVSALSLIPNILGGNFSLNPDQQTKIIDGLTKYYAEEFRKAQLLTYMQTFKGTIGKIGELQILFPQTYAKLESTDPSRFPELGDEYKSIFNEDLKLVVDNLINHIDNQTTANQLIPDSVLSWLNSMNVSVIKTNQYYKCFKMSADIGSKLIHNYHPVELLNYIDNKYYYSTLNYDATNHKSLILQNADSIHKKIILLFHGLNLVQKNVLDTAKRSDIQFANVWLNLQDLKMLKTNDEWLYFAGLIYQQDKEYFDKYIFTATGKTLKTVTSDDIFTIKSRINSVLSSLNEIQKFRSNLKEENLKDNFVGYMNLILKSLESANSFSNNSTSLNLSIAELRQYLTLADYTMKIYDNARKKDYNNTIYYAIKILNQFHQCNSKDSIVANTIEQYENFMTDVINSKNSDEAKDVIKKYAAQPASFILKREYKRTFSVTGQPGYFASYEKFDGHGKQFKFLSGITLPLGFEMTFKYRNGKENKGSIGLFAQIIDLGAVLNFRIGDSTSTLPDKIDIEQIFSPGGSINYGFKNSPVTLGIGYQYSPQLRRITESGNEIYPNGHRIFLRMSWDIPFLNISKSKNK